MNILVDMLLVKGMLEIQKCVKVIRIIALRRYINELRVGVIFKLKMGNLRGARI